MKVICKNKIRKFKVKWICLQGSPKLSAARVKEKLEQLPCEQFLQAFEISRSFLRAKQVGENPVKIAHKAAVLFLLSL